MPAGKDPVPERDVAFIERWIDDGCPDEEIVELHAFAREEGLGPLAQADEGLDKFVTFFRSFDYFFMFGSHPEHGMVPRSANSSDWRGNGQAGTFLSKKSHGPI